MFITLLGFQKGQNLICGDVADGGKFVGALQIGGDRKDDFWECLQILRPEKLPRGYLLGFNFQQS